MKMILGKMFVGFACLFAGMMFLDSWHSEPITLDVFSQSNLEHFLGVLLIGIAGRMVLFP